MNLIMKKYLFIILLVGVYFGKSNNDFEKAKLMHDSGQYDESKLILTNLISESTDSHIITQSLFELGRVLITTKEYKNAYKIFKRLIERDPNFKPNVLIIFPEFEVQDQSLDWLDSVSHLLEHYGGSRTDAFSGIKVEFE